MGASGATFAIFRSTFRTGAASERTAVCVGSLFVWWLEMAVTVATVSGVQMVRRPSQLDVDGKSAERIVMWVRSFLVNADGVTGTVDVFICDLKKPVIFVCDPTLGGLKM